MKKILILIFMLSLAPITSVAQRVKPSEHSRQVNYVSEAKGQVTVRSIGWGKKDAPALADAELRAVETILFVGLPEAQKHGAMVANESQVRSNNKMFFNELLSGQGYKRFVMNSTAKGKLSKQKGAKMKSMPVDVTINTNALKKYLEQNDIIRGFGF